MLSFGWFKPWTFSDFVTINFILMTLKIFVAYNLAVIDRIDYQSMILKGLL